MAKYIDGFVVPLPNGRTEDYRVMAEKAGQVWMDHGALEYVECIGDDLDIAEMGPTFPKMARLKEGETVAFSYIVYKSREHRDEVNAKVMEDPRMKEMMQEEPFFDCKRMAYGGFKAIVER